VGVACPRVAGGEPDMRTPVRYEEVYTTKEVASSMQKCAGALVGSNVR
jgi:hypothetical protein